MVIIILKKVKNYVCFSENSRNIDLLPHFGLPKMQNKY